MRCLFLLVALSLLPSPVQAQLDVIYPSRNLIWTTNTTFQITFTFPPTDTVRPPFLDFDLYDATQSIGGRVLSLLSNVSVDAVMACQTVQGGLLTPTLASSSYYFVRATGRWSDPTVNGQVPVIGQSDLFAVRSPPDAQGSADSLQWVSPQFGDVAKTGETFVFQWAYTGVLVQQDPVTLTLYRFRHPFQPGQPVPDVDTVATLLDNQSNTGYFEWSVPLSLARVGTVYYAELTTRVVGIPFKAKTDQFEIQAGPGATFLPPAATPTPALKK